MARPIAQQRVYVLPSRSLRASPHFAVVIATAKRRMHAKRYTKSGRKIY